MFVVFESIWQQKLLFNFKTLTKMKELSFDEMVDTMGGDLCGSGNNAGIICFRGGDTAYCFSCGGEFLYAEPW